MQQIVMFHMQKEALEPVLYYPQEEQKTTNVFYTQEVIIQQFQKLDY